MKIMKRIGSYFTEREIVCRPYHGTFIKAISHMDTDYNCYAGYLLKVAVCELKALWNC